MAEPSGSGDSISLECPGLDTAAGEEFLQEVFQILLEEGVRKSTDVTQKVTPASSTSFSQGWTTTPWLAGSSPRPSTRARTHTKWPQCWCSWKSRSWPSSGSLWGGAAATGSSLPSHYSILKGAALLGIGTDNVHLVRTDERGKMIPEELEKEIQRVKAEGSEPLFVCATSGTTVLGAFDPLDAIADVCARHGLWLHVDAAWGGSALLSPRLRHLLAGIHRADSVTWNPHKLLMVGLQCSAFLLHDSSGLLQRCHGVGASYLFQRDKFYDVSLDTGDKSPQCGRRADSLKLWILWKAVGTRGLAQRVERAFSATRYLLEQVKRREGFQLVMEPEFINLCFWFIPPSLRGQENSPEFWDKLGKVAPAIKEKMIRRGSMMVGYQPQGSHVNFFRQIITNPAVTRQDLDFFLDEIQELGWDL
ncbi:cysteine sulfinic acid decarboxylase isoform X4 [Agelaius phoeniceus]|uniref:cysteine sulfinic acid decarboxylase isoform X4 n=1 Tax=Agelaius phoeniceus TaxID=39638 RepID=UPI004054F7A8